MSRDKQTEIANDLNMHCVSLSEQFCGEMSCNACISNWLYNAGYRKSQNVAEEIFAEIDDFQRTLRHIFLDMCGGNDYNTLNLLQIDSAIEALFNSRIAELKKKYESEKDE